jgi:inner membrane transporter RhtA
MSGQPALGALSGLLILNETLNLWQLGGIVAIIVASLGATVTIARNTPPPVA